MRLRNGAALAARTYLEHVLHVRDVRDVPVQGLVEAGGELPGGERGGGGEECSGVRCRGAGLQARWEAGVRWRNGAAARAYIEHVFHVRDLRDVPVQELVKAGGALPVGLPGAERGRRAMLRRACVQRRRAAGEAGGLCAVARWGSGQSVPRTCCTCS